MLEYMHVKNLALIKDCEIKFSKGLNILTGETGAGKSILMGSVNLALGAKADKDIIRTGEDEGYVELVFSINNEVEKLLSEMEISFDDSVVISRKITPTKNVFKINGEIVPAKQVKELAGTLLDVHGQHEHQSLLSNIKQREMLDAFGGQAVSNALADLAVKCRNYCELRAELDSCLKRADSRGRELELLKFECNQIEEAKLVPGEDEKLEEYYKRMQSAGKLLSFVNESIELISSGNDMDAGSLISRAIGNLKKASMIDDEASRLEGLLTECENLLGDFSIEASRYADTLEFSQEDYSETENRLNIINSLKAKFGSSIEAILAYYEEKSNELEKMENLDEYILELKKSTENALSEYRKQAGLLSRIRKEAAVEFSKLLSDELKSLSFLDSSFGIDFDSDEAVISEHGFDKIEFMISVNPGEPRKPMRNVSSGGELSRIMLACKTILANKDYVDALIFDEIDTGISGRTAWEVAARLSKLSRQHQVISITHLAQIAAFSDAHYEIEKSYKGNETTTNIFLLDEEGQIRELGRLLGTDHADEATLTNARELKKKANDRKREIND